VRRLLALLAIACLCSAAAALVGGARDGATSPALAFATPAAAAATAPRCPIPSAYRRHFEAASHSTGLPLSLLVAVAEVESRLDAHARSDAGAQGLLQVLPSTGATLGLDVSDPAANVLAGARYLRQQLERFGSTDLALSAYNAGPTAVERAGGAPTGETLTYVANVKARWSSLRGCR
jgi:soluble lytic murein transglycosylase-like protein